MKRGKNWREMRKSLHGWGGLKCPCCNYWFTHPRKSKPLERRFIRRKLKQELDRDQEKV